MSGIDRLAVAAEVLENPLDHGRFLDARDHPQLPAAPPADRDVDRKDTFEALRPARGPLPVVRGRWLAGLQGFAGRSRARPEHDPVSLPNIGLG
jgi:hypothetical protein